MASNPTTEPLGIAVEAEKQSLAVYLRLAWETTDPGGKNMFIRLAQDEYDHMRLLERQQAALVLGGSWGTADLPLSVVERVVAGLSSSDRRIRGGRGQDRLAALLSALNLEEKARDFYSEQARQAGDAAARATYTRLAEMEQAHADLLQAEVDSIQQTGYWFTTREFTLEAPER